MADFGHVEEPFGSSLIDSKVMDCITEDQKGYFTVAIEFSFGIIIVKQKIILDNL